MNKKAIQSKKRWEREKKRIKEIKSKRTGVIDRRGRKWTSDDLSYLEIKWGELHIYAIAKKLGRTADAVSQKAIQLGLGPSNRGTYSVKNICDKTGMSKKAIYNIVERLGIKIRESPACRRHMIAYRYSIDEEDLHKIIDFVKKLKGFNLGPKNMSRSIWGVAPHPDSCKSCSRNNVDYYAKGFCRSCYQVNNYWEKKENKNGKNKRKTSIRLTREVSSGRLLRREWD